MRSPFGSGVLMPRRRLAALAACLLLLASGPATHAAARPLQQQPAGGGAKKAPFFDEISFEGSALLITYYSGVAEVLIGRGALVPGTTPLSGLSGGALTAAVTTLGMGGAAQRDGWMGMVKDCAKRWGTCAGRLNTVVTERLRSALPDDAAAKLGSVVRVGLSQLDAQSRAFNGSASWVVGAFDDKADVVSALTATDFIPCFSGPTTYTLFRDQPVIDGGYANGFQQLCRNVSSCLTIGSYVVGPLANHTCDAAACPNLAKSGCGSDGRAEPIPQTLFKNGPVAAQWKVSALRDRCPASAFAAGADTAPYPLPGMVPQSQTDPWIHPGKFNPLPVKPWDGKRVAACEWQEWALSPPPEHALDIMQLTYAQGVRDAESWADANGFPAVKAAGADKPQAASGGAKPQAAARA
ncbi:hypothetical protein Rsub_00798 [Raphidocelis subcapitata]|uniref:PNPLA domain-containing protein n=1 Tax=Raphidocelis subcapitata TaxID=307507 RepID=A0A2V0NL25_9CHLO|nr:hypothetical protein Rsub_00798 [Raphidocelis subcapitata]|eukprot:GBF88086.1 hypothetical protein Rsub_00798 [Raphidocelis subcapitata]